MDPADIRIACRGDGYLNLLVAAEARDELLADLSAADLRPQVLVEESAAVEQMAIVLVALGGPRGITAGLGAVAAVITAWGHRHDGKVVRVRNGEQEIEATGYSAAELEHLLRIAAGAEPGSAASSTIGADDAAGPGEGSASAG